MANSGLPTFAVELTHNIGSTENYPESWIGNTTFFNELYDAVGANGNDYIWFCSGDEVVEYMYYQRVAIITKTITSTGCRFNISFDIPDYLSYKTYSVKIKNLPSNAVVAMTTDKTLTYYSKNINTGLINWGISTDISERANRYLAAYKANPTNDTLDRAWYFVKQMGEMGTTLAAQLPAFNEKPVISSITYNATPTDSAIDITTVNNNKEFGEADYLDISIDDTFNSCTTYKIPSGEHKYYDSLDSATRNNIFSININPNFGVANTYYARLRNFYGKSNTYSMDITLTRIAGVNDPAIEFILPDKFTSDTEVIFTITHSYISAMRYKLTDTFTDWESPVDSITIPMTKGTTYTLVVQGKNNLDEIVEKTYTINFTGKQQIVLFGNVNAGTVTGVGYVNKTSRSFTDCPTVYDLEGNSFCTEQGQYEGYYDTQIAALRTKWGLLGYAGLSEAYWSIPALIEENGTYPNSLIVNGNLRNVSVYGDVQPNKNWQTSKFLTSVPQGTYKVRLLLSSGSEKLHPNIIRVNNDTITIPDSTHYLNNNSYWYEFNNATVGSDGYMLISQYTDPSFTVGYYNLAPIVLIEITKLT
jgi:hypothetical protein